MSFQENTPGLYVGLPAAVYHRSKLCSSSVLKEFERSPQHALTAQQRDFDEDRESFIVGTALHSAVLEPEVYAEGYVRAIEGDGRTKAVKEAREKQAAECHGKIILKPDHYDSVNWMAAAIAAHPTASLVLGDCTPAQKELSIIWDDVTGVRCKARVDAISPEYGAIIDIKTTEDAGQRWFPKDIVNHRYYRQLAMYRRGLKAHGLNFSEAVIVAVEKSEPYAIAYYRITPEYLTLGDMELDRMLTQWKECETTGVWPAYSDDFQDVNPPEWLIEREAA